MKVLETPGHTPESISIVVYDIAADPARPHAVLTGDTLFIGDVGRPDLRAALEREGLSDQVLIPADGETIDLDAALLVR